MVSGGRILDIIDMRMSFEQRSPMIRVRHYESEFFKGLLSSSKIKAMINYIVEDYPEEKDSTLNTYVGSAHRLKGLLKFEEIRLNELSP
jgi:hypothetical protein